MRPTGPAIRTPRPTPYTDPVPNWANYALHDGQAEAARSSASSTEQAQARTCRRSRHARPEVRYAGLSAASGSASSCWWCSSASTSPSSSRTRRRSIRSSRRSPPAPPSAAPARRRSRLMRQSLRELYGLQGGLLRAVPGILEADVVGDFGPSLSAFPTPVSVLIWRALPWTAGLLFVSTLLAWCLGNLLGGLAGYYRDSRTAAARRRRGDGLPSDPLLHRRLRAADRVRLSLAGAADQRRRRR